MAETLNDSLVKVTEELKEANTRSLEATKELGKVTAATKASYKEVGESVRESLGINKLKDMVMSLPGMNIAKAVGGVVMKKRREKQEQMNLAKRLGITRNQLLLQKAEQEVVLAKEEESKKLIEAAEKLGFNTDRIAKVNEEGNIELNGSLRESNGQFVSKANASAEANLSALKDFGTSVSEKMPETPSFTKSGPSGASASEDAGEERRITEAQLNEQEKQTSLLQQLVDGGLGEKGEKGEKEKGGFLEKLGSLRLALMGLPALLAGKLKALKLGAKTVASTVASKAGGLVRGAKPLAKVALRGAATAAKFIPGIGLAVTAAMGIFDGMSAGIEEYKKSGKLGAAVKEGIAGGVSGLTFGLVSQESISAGMDKIGEFAKGAWDGYTGIVSGAVSGVGTVLNSAVDGFENLTGLTVPTNLTEVKDAVSNTISSAVSGFNNLTGLSVPENLSELKTAVSDGLSNAAKGFNNLTGLSLPTNLTELKDSVASTFDNIGAGFTNLTGIEVPTFDDLSAKVGAFADNMKENIAKGWEGITNMASDAWGGVKGFFGFGGDDDTEEKNLKQEKIEKIKDQKLANDMEMEEISQRMDKFEKGKNAYLGRDTKKKYNKDEARFNELMAENESLDQDLSTASITYPTEMQYGFAGDSGGRVFYKYTPDGEIQIAKNQEEASLEYKSPTSSNVTPLDSPRTVEQTSMLQQSNSTAAQIARDYMKNDGNTTVVNAPQNSTVTNMNGGGGGTVIPTVMTDNSSASQAAYANV